MDQLACKKYQHMYVKYFNLTILPTSFLYSTIWSVNQCEEKKNLKKVAVFQQF